VRRAKRGDGLAFARLLEPNLDQAFRLAMTMLNNRVDAEDAIQDAALKAWRAFGRFRENSELRPWFLSIVANECRSLRRTRWWRTLSLEAVREPAQSVEMGLVENIDLQRALDRLPHRHLLPLTLYYHLDLPIEEVARILGCSVGSARVRIHRALQALRPALDLEVDV